MTSLQKNEHYMRYAALATRPLGMKAFEINEDGKVVIAPGELFCRVEDEDDVLCARQTRFSHTGNLRTHVLGHDVELAGVRKGTISAQETRAAIKFYKHIMQIHDTLTAPYDPAAENSTSMPSPVAPSKGPPVLAPPSPHEHRPALPRKKDGTINKAAMKRIAGYKSKCNGCKHAGAKSCPGALGVCDIYDDFTDESDNEEVMEVGKSAGEKDTQIISSSASSLSGPDTDMEVDKE